MTRASQKEASREKKYLKVSMLFILLVFSQAAQLPFSQRALSFFKGRLTHETEEQ